MFHNQGFQLWTISSDVAATSHGSNHIKLKYCKTTLTAMKKRPKYLLDQRIMTQSQQNWLAKLLGYEFEIIYKAGATNQVVDALSRKENDKEI